MKQSWRLDVGYKYEYLVCLHILSMLVDMVFIIKDMVIFLWRPNLISAMGVIEVTTNPPSVIAPFLAGIASHGGFKRSMVCLLLEMK